MSGLSVLLFLVSLLTVLRAPAKPLWYIAIGVTEWGHILAMVSLLLAWVNWRTARRWTWAVSLALGSALLLLTPLCRAAFIADQLPHELASRFGNIAPRQSMLAPARSTPLSWKDLFTGVSSPEVRVSKVTYGNNLQLDLYQPPLTGFGHPGVVVIHGGSWQSGDRQEFPNLNRYLAARGYVVAAIDYRLAPDAIFPAQMEDVFSAIRYLQSHAATIGLDKTQLVLLGRSAGGQIALSAAYAEKNPAVKGVIVFYAPNDLAWGYSVPANPLIMNSRQVIETYLGGPPSRMNYDAASPLRSVNKSTPPTLMIHGVRDELVAAKHEERLSRQLEAAGRPYFYLRLPWATHGCDANFSGPSGQLSTFAIERFLAAVMPPPQGSKGVQ